MNYKNKLFVFGMLENNYVHVHVYFKDIYVLVYVYFKDIYVLVYVYFKDKMYSLFPKTLSPLLLPVY